MRHAKLFFAAGAMAGCLFSGAVFADEGQNNPPAAGNQMPGAMAGRLITASAKVEKVDADKKELTLKADSGKPFTIQVPESVSRLDNVKPGDRLNVGFYESVAISLEKPGESPVGERNTLTRERAPGNLPGGSTIDRVTTTAKIKSMDAANHEVTIETPTGKSNTIQVQDPDVRAAMKKLKVGDEVQATFTQAMATSITPKKHM